MAVYTIIGSDGKQYGSVTEEQLRQWIADGRVNARTRTQLEGAAGWQSLSEFPEFAAALNSSAPPPLSASTPAVPAKAGASGLAIASLVLGISGMFTCGTTALIGLVLGIVAMVGVSKSRGALGGFGIALAGTIVSGIFLFMIPIYAALLLPALAAARQKAEAINCVSNERQLAMAVRIYASQNTNHFPAAVTWCDAIKPDVGSVKVFKCVAVNPGGECDYAFNAGLDGMDEAKIAPNTVMIFESDGGWNAHGGPELMIRKPRHAGVFVVAFADGSVQQLRESQINTLRWNP
jgi:prepilin-type processing-associated H-X9-DG protein